MTTTVAAPTASRRRIDGSRPKGAAARRAARNPVLVVLLEPFRVATRAFRRLRDRCVPENFGVVEEGRIYRSARLTAGALRLVHARHGIRTIVDLAADRADDPRRHAEWDAIRSLGIRRIALRLRGDGQGDPASYAEAVRVLADPASHPVLVHCAAGSNRTSTTVVYYLTLCRGASLDDAAAGCRPFGCDFRVRTEHWDYVVGNLTTVREMLADPAPV